MIGDRRNEHFAVERHCHSLTSVGVGEQLRIDRDFVERVRDVGIDVDVRNLRDFGSVHRIRFENDVDATFAHFVHADDRVDDALHDEARCLRPRFEIGAVCIEGNPLADFPRSEFKGARSDRRRCEFTFVFARTHIDLHILSVIF